VDFIEFYPDKQQYESSMEFGIGMRGSAKNLTSSIFKDTATIQTNFLYTSYIGFEGEPGWDEHGNYTITFQIIRENGRVFLRFVDMRQLK